MKRFSSCLFLASLLGVLYGLRAAPIWAQVGQAAGPLQTVLQVDTNIFPIRTQDFSKSAQFNFAGKGSGLAEIEAFSNAPGFLKATAVPPYVANLQSQFEQPLGLLRTVKADLQSKISIQDPVKFLFQSGPSRSVADELMKTNDQSLELDSFLSSQIADKYRDGVRRAQIAAMTDPAVNRELRELQAIAAIVNRHGRELATTSELARLNEIWDRTAGAHTGELHDALNSPRTSGALLQSSVRADAPWEIQQFPSARLQPADAKTAWTLEVASAMRDIAPQIKIRNVGLLLSQLGAQTEKDVNLEKAMSALGKHHPEWHTLLNSQQTFLLNAASQQEPNLLELLGIGSENTATGHVRILIAGQDMMPVLIVARPPHRRMSAKEFERMLEQSAAPYFAMQHMMAVQQNGSRLARAAAKPAFHLFHNVDDPSITRAPSRIDRLPWSAASVSWQLDLARKAAKRAWAENASQLYPRFDFPGTYTADAADLTARILLLPVMRDIARSERPDAPAAAYVH